MEAAYTDASDCPSDHFYSGNSFPTMMLPPGVYEFTSDVTVPVGGEISFNGEDDADAVWIMQIAGNLLISSDSSVELFSGAKIENIFWAVDGNIVVGSNADAVGIMLSHKSISLQFGSTLIGAAYAQTYVILEEVPIIGGIE